MCISCNHAPASPGAYPRALHTHSPLRLFKCCQPPLRQAERFGTLCRGPARLQRPRAPRLPLSCHHSSYAQEEFTFPEHLSDIQNKNYVSVWWMKNMKLCEVKRAWLVLGRQSVTKARRKSKVFPVTVPYAVYTLFHGCSESLQFILHMTDALT